MRSLDLCPESWTHFDRYFLSAVIRGSEDAAAAVMCVSRWSPRLDWQIIKIEIRAVPPDRRRRNGSGPPVMTGHESKADLPRTRRLPAAWFPDEAELVNLRPIPPRVLAMLDHDLHDALRRHVLAYDLVESVDEIDSDHVVVMTARRYRQLLNIGDTSPAALLSEWTLTPVRTIHNRLRIARERGLLPPVPRGTRAADDPVAVSRGERDLLDTVIAPRLDGPKAGRVNGQPVGGTRGRVVRSARSRGRAPISLVR